MDDTRGSIGKIMVNCAMYISILKNTPYIYGFFCKDARRQAGIILTDGSEVSHVD